MGDRVHIFEVGPRDGLQNEPAMIATALKVQLIDLLSATGLERIEAASFVSPQWVPQMADSAEVLAAISRRPGVVYAALVPNLKGYERARSVRPDEVAVFVSASEGFSQKNTNCSIAESLVRLRAVAAAANADRVPVRGYISCAVACPYDGPTPPETVAALTAALLDMGCYQVSLGDTIGAGVPSSIARMLDAVLQTAPAAIFAGHYHNTGGAALRNIAVSLERGLRTFDASIAGLGGCPFAPGAPGNVATETVAAYLAQNGYETGLDAALLDTAERFALEIKGALRQ